jgi:hypothetical protein
MPLLLPLMKQKQEQLLRELSAYTINNIFIGAWPTKKHLRDYLWDLRRSITGWLGPQKEKKYVKSSNIIFVETQERYIEIEKAIMEIITE